MRLRLSHIFLAFTSIALISCASSKAAKQKKFSNNDYFFNPNVSLVHTSNDSSLITVEFSNDDILYARKHSSEPFQANLTIEISDVLESGKTDTLKLTVRPPLKEEDGVWRLQVPSTEPFSTTKISPLRPQSS